MSADLLEFIVIVVAGVLITSVVYELGQITLKRTEDRRNQDRADQRSRRRWRQ
jgi:hypothetical protein